MDDLLAYANSDRGDPVTQAAVAHGQFETIHPFGDGKGRIGRVLIARILARRCRLLHLPPPTVLSARDAGGSYGSTIARQITSKGRRIRCNTLDKPTVPWEDEGFVSSSRIYAVEHKGVSARVVEEAGRVSGTADDGTGQAYPVPLRQQR